MSQSLRKPSRGASELVSFDLTNPPRSAGSHTISLHKFHSLTLRETLPKSPQTVRTKAPPNIYPSASPLTSWEITPKPLVAPSYGKWRTSSKNITSYFPACLIWWVLHGKRKISFSTFHSGKAIAVCGDTELAWWLQSGVVSAWQGLWGLRFSKGLDGRRGRGFKGKQRSLQNCHIREKTPVT